MRYGLLSRLSYANVMATVAVFLALGGGAYALSGIPDRSGVYHGCVATSGALRVVTKASSCRKAKTVTRGRHRVRIPGESAITWNQQGRSGVNGANGLNGANGAPATALWAVVSRDGTLISGSGATSQPMGMDPIYHVTFSRDVSQCALVGTARNDTQNTFVVATPNATNPKQVDVTVAPNNTSITIAAFSLAAFC